MPLANSQLNSYFTNEVQVKREETKRAKQIVNPIVNQMVDYLHKKDPRFGANPTGVGSSFQGLKTHKPDEFDFSILLEGLGQFYWRPRQPRYYHIIDAQTGKVFDYNNSENMPDVKVVATGPSLPAPPNGYTFVQTGNKDSCPIWKNSDDLMFSGDLIPFLVKRRLKELLQEAIRNISGLRGKVTLGRKAHGPALTIRIPCKGISDMEEISVDFAPTVPMHICFPDHVKWPRVNSLWPSREKREQVQALGINVTAKKPYYWMYSFAACERELMSDMDRDGGCRKRAHRIMKRLREEYWCKGTGKAVVSSYVLKNVLLWECEKYPHNYQWQNDQLATRVESMIKFLLQSLNKKELKLYFYDDVNLINVKDANELETLENELNRIREFLANPSKYLECS